MKINEVYKHLRWIKDDCRNALNPLRELMSFTKGDWERLEKLRRRIGRIWHITVDKMKEVDEWQRLTPDKQEILLDSLPRMMNKMLLVWIDAGVIFEKYEKAEDAEQDYLEKIGRALDSIEEHHLMLSIDIINGDKERSINADGVQIRR